MIVKLLTSHRLEFLNLKGGCRGSFESAHVKMPHCWKSHALAQFNLIIIDFNRLVRLRIANRTTVAISKK